MHAKPGKRAEIEDYYDRYSGLGDAIAPGCIAVYALWHDGDPDWLTVLAVFDSRESYRANAASPAQHQRYLQLRELLEEDPHWSDGEVTPFLKF